MAVTLLPSLPECWDYVCELPYLILAGLPASPTEYLENGDRTLGAHIPLDQEMVTERRTNGGP